MVGMVVIRIVRSKKYRCEDCGTQMMSLIWDGIEVPFMCPVCEAVMVCPQCGTTYRCPKCEEMFKSEE
jgi:hypothetical protein